MDRSAPWFNARARLAIAFGLVAAGWLLVTPRDLHYREQVQLSNGEIIEIERVIEATPMGEIGGPGGWEATHNSLLVTSSSVPAPPRWASDVGFVPLLLDRDATGGDWYLIATFYTCAAWRRIGRPELPCAAFRGSGGGWMQIPLSPQLIGRNANVLTTISSKGERSPVTLADKANRNSEPTIGKTYLKIMDRWDRHC